MNERDAEAFSRALREAFPEIRFVPDDYWDVRSNDAPRRRRGVNELDLIYYDHLGVSDEKFFRC